MERSQYWTQPQPEIKTIPCCCGYSVPADKIGLAILRHHQSLCDKFKGVEAE
jgi:hypothetical protein